MDIFDVVEFYGKLQKMKTLIAKVPDKELKHKMDKNFQWLMEHSSYKSEQTAIEVM